MIAWVAILIQMRSRQKPRRDWTWTIPAAFVLAGIAFYAPDLWGMVLVYLHPLIGFWILDRELRRRRGVAPGISPLPSLPARYFSAHVVRVRQTHRLSAKSTKIC